MEVDAGAVAGNNVWKTISRSLNASWNIVCVDIVVGLAARTTVMRMEAAAVVDDRVADVKVEEAMVVMEATVEVAEEEVGDGEGHQVWLVTVPVNFQIQWLQFTI